MELGKYSRVEAAVIAVVPLAVAEHLDHTAEVQESQVDLTSELDLGTVLKLAAVAVAAFAAVQLKGGLQEVKEYFVKAP